MVYSSRNFYSQASRRRGRGYLLVWSSPRRSAAFGIDDLKLRWADRQTGRLGTPRLQACLDRSSPVSGCCGLMLLGVEDSPARSQEECPSAAVPQTIDMAPWKLLHSCYTCIFSIVYLLEKTGNLSSLRTQSSLSNLNAVCVCAFSCKTSEGTCKMLRGR